MSRALPLWLWAALAWGCQGAAPAPAIPAASTLSAPLAAAPAGRPVALAPADRLLDADADRTLIGTLAPAPPNADPPLRMALRLEVRDAPTPLPGVDPEVERARLVPGGLLITTRGHDLTLLAGAAPPRVLAHGVQGAVGASLDGRHLVFTKGEMPDFEVYRLSPGAPDSKLVAAEMAPAWSPGITPDGSVVFFVSSKTGVPAWWRVADGGAPVQLTNVGLAFKPGAPPPALTPVASGLGPTLVTADLVIFASDAAVHVMTADGRFLRDLPGASSPHWLVPGAVVGVYDAARGAIVPLALAEVPR